MYIGQNNKIQQHENIEILKKEGIKSIKNIYYPEILPKAPELRINFCKFIIKTTIITYNNDNNFLSIFSFQKSAYFFKIF